MSTRIPAVFVSVVIVAALAGYAWNLFQANATIELKDTLRKRSAELSGMAPEEWVVPEGAFALLINDDGTVQHETNAPRVRNTNFLKDNDDRTSQMFQKMKSRALTGGGYVDFKWVNPDTDELQPFIAYAVRNKNNQTACIAQSTFRPRRKVPPPST